MRPASATLVLLLGLAAAEARTPEAFTVEESAALHAEHARAADRIDAQLDAIAARRLGYADAPDADASLARWTELFTPIEGLNAEMKKAWEEHRRRTNALEILRVGGALERAHVEGDADVSTTPDLAAVQDDNRRMAVRQNKLFDRYATELTALDDARLSRNLARRREGDARTAVRAALAAAAAALLVALWSRRGAPRPGGAPPPAAPASPPPLVGGNIRVVRPIGRGGMGEVYEGLDVTLQRKVALKRLRPELTGSADDLSRLLKEARLVATLKHPNVVAIHSVEKEAGQVFLVFEYVDGPTLTTLLSQRRQLPWPEALKVFQGAAAALQAAHARNIVHRDLKPGNIMLDSKGVVKVMDFGIASEAAMAVSKLTRSGAWGTPPYMSPEQELGEVNAGVDLFALNVVLYEMLTGELPFTGPNFLAQKREGVYIPVTQAVPALPKALDVFFATAFCPDPAKRFPDAATLSAAAGALS
ncbi:serine/threonine protein kinase [bacterium]|nr:MAG: serine/threonine protein kinase [bacterium]